MRVSGSAELVTIGPQQRRAVTAQSQVACLIAIALHCALSRASSWSLSQLRRKGQQSALGAQPGVVSLQSISGCSKQYNDSFTCFAFLSYSAATNLSRPCPYSRKYSYTQSRVACPADYRQMSRHREHMQVSAKLQSIPRESMRLWDGLGKSTAHPLHRKRASELFLEVLALQSGGTEIDWPSVYCAITTLTRLDKECLQARLAVGCSKSQAFSHACQMYLLQMWRCTTNACLPETISLSGTCLPQLLPSTHLDLICLQAYMWLKIALHKINNIFCAICELVCHRLSIICLQANWSSDGCCMTGTCTQCIRRLCASNVAWLVWLPSRALVGTTRQPGSAEAASQMLHPAQMFKMV